MSVFVKDSERASTEFEFTYRITGKQSIERLEPLIESLRNEWFHPVSYCNFSSDPSTIPTLPLQFVWETTCEKSWKQIHSNAKILNKMNNTSIIESKSNLAFLQLLMNCPTLKTFVARNTKEVQYWIQSYYLATSTSSTEKKEELRYNPHEDWWVIKASNGNGGKDIWMINSHNFQEVASSIPDMNEEYVIQKYVRQPLLYQGKYKFHFRCYGLLTATFQSYVYEKAFILTSGLEFSDDIHDQRRHITNLSVNKHFAHHPGQVPCIIPNEYPELFGKIQKIWAELCHAAKRFMLCQDDERRFEFFGFDIVADEDNECWLIEVNRLPGLESSKNNLIEEDELYDEMMTSVLKIVLYPSLQEEVRKREPSSVQSDLLQLYSHIPLGFWSDVTQLVNASESGEGSAPHYHNSSDSQNEENLAYKNLLKWKMFTRIHRKKILVETSLSPSSTSDSSK